MKDARVWGFKMHVQLQESQALYTVVCFLKAVSYERNISFENLLFQVYGYSAFLYKVTDAYQQLFLESLVHQESAFSNAAVQLVRFIGRGMEQSVMKS